MMVTLWLENLLAYSVQVCALVLAGGLLARLLPLGAAKTRLAYWQALLLLCLVWPAVQPWRAAAASVEGEVSVSLGPASALAPPIPTHTHVDVSRLVAGLLVTGAAFRLGWLVLGLARLTRYRRRARPASETPTALAELRRTLGLQVDIRLSDDVDGPSTFGLLRPTVLLPAACARLPLEQARAIACHELLHVRRGDWGFTVAEECLRAVLWFHPAVHWLIGRVRVGREQAVDSEVVSTCGLRQPYLEALIETARLVQRPRPVPALLGLGHSHLKERIELLLEEVAMPSLSKSRLTLHTLVCATAVLAVGALATRSFPLTGPADAKVKPAAKAESAANREPRIIEKQAPVYPPAAKAAGIEGSVVLELKLDKAGHVSDAKIVQGAPERVVEGTSGQPAGKFFSQSLDQAAIDAVKQWRYEPVLGPEGKPIETALRVTVRFQLRDKTAQAEAQKDDYVAPLKVISTVKPVYPPEAKAAGSQGTVELEVTIDTSGGVGDVRIIKSVPAFDKAAVDAVKQWRFQPPLNGAGKPVAATARVPVVFKLY